MDTQANLDFFYAFKNKRICILCAESTPEHCHRRLISEKISKNSRLARPRLYNAGAFSYDAHAAARGGTPGRPRQDFRFDFLTRSMRRNSPQTARADDRGGAEMIKIRVQGLPEEVAEFADALEAAGCVLERSEPYANRGGSRYVRVYIDAQKPAADGGAREIEEG